MIDYSVIGFANVVANFPIKTHHIVDGEDVSLNISRVEVIQFFEDEDFYLIYRDSSGLEVSDTLHSSIDSAIDQANFEFGIEKSDWNWILEYDAS